MADRCEVCAILLGDDAARKARVKAAIEAVAGDELGQPTTGQAFRLGGEWFDTSDVLQHVHRRDELVELDAGRQTWWSKIEGHPTLPDLGRS